MTSGPLDSHYTRTLAEPGSYPTLKGDVTVDVAIVGGGYSGCAAAIELAERGQRVALVEAKTIGWGASGRNGGFASEGFPGGYTALVEKVGLARAQATQTIARMGLDLLKRRIADHAIQCGPVTQGALRCNIAEGGEDLRQFQDFMQRSFGVDYDYWPREKVEAHLSTRRYSDALFVPGTVAIHPLNFARGLARVAAERGAAIYENTPATRISSAGGRRHLQTPQGRVFAERIVIAGGGYVHGLNAKLSGATIPVMSFVMATEPLGERLREAIRVPYAIFDNTVAVNYYRPLADGRLLWGGRVSAWNPGTKRIGEALLRDAVSFYPGLAGAKVETAWGGAMPFTRYKLPVIAEMEPGLWCITGCGGLGVALTSALGHLVATAITQSDERWKLFDFGLPFGGGRLGRLPAQAVYFVHQLRAAIGRPATH